MKKIAILDFGLGNVRSVSNALRAIGVEAVITRDATEIARAEALIIPGVGAFPHGMKNLKTMGLIDVLHQFINSGRSILGICLGMQLFFERGLEHEFTEGLGILSGSVEIIPINLSEGRLPHIAWSVVEATEFGAKNIFKNMSTEEMRFYFIHSYAATNISDQNLSALVEYGGHKMVAAIQQDNIWGVQFHPEKSGPTGLRVLKNFIDSIDKG